MKEINLISAQKIHFCLVFFSCFYILSCKTKDITGTYRMVKPNGYIGCELQLLFNHTFSYTKDSDLQKKQGKGYWFVKNGVLHLKNDSCNYKSCVSLTFKKKNTETITAIGF